MAESILTKIFKSLISPFQLTSSVDDKSAADNNKSKAYCEWDGAIEPDTHPAVEWFIKEVTERKKALAEKSPDELKQFSNYMRFVFIKTVDKDDDLLRAMEQSRLSTGTPLGDIVAITNNNRVHIFEDNQNIDNQVARLDSRVQDIVKKYFGEKDADDLKDISMGNYLLNHVRSKCLQEANSKEHNVLGTDAVVHDVIAPTMPNVPLAKSNNNAIR